MSEQRALYTAIENACTITDAPHVKRGHLSTRNLDEFERDLAQLERKLVPLINQVRAMRGKKPIRIDD